MIKKSDGTFDYTDEFKSEQEQANQNLIDEINKKASAKQKLIDLGLTTEEIKALIGV